MIEWYISLVKEIYGNFEHWILPIFFHNIGSVHYWFCCYL